MEQASPTIAMRGMKASISECVPNDGTRSGDNVFLHTSIAGDERFAEREDCDELLGPDASIEPHEE